MSTPHTSSSTPLLQTPVSGKRPRQGAVTALVVLGLFGAAGLTSCGNSQDAFARAHGPRYGIEGLGSGGFAARAHDDTAELVSYFAGISGNSARGYVETLTPVNRSLPSHLFTSSVTNGCRADNGATSVKTIVVTVNPAIADGKHQLNMTSDVVIRDGEKESSGTVQGLFELTTKGGKVTNATAVKFLQSPPSKSLSTFGPPTKPADAVTTPCDLTAVSPAAFER